MQVSTFARAVCTLIPLCCWSARAQSVNVGAITNAASFEKGPVAPGTIVSIFGSNLSRNTTTASALPLPVSLDGTSVTVGNQVIPLFFVSPGQINAQLPFNLQSGSALLTVKNGGGLSGNFTFVVTNTSPAVFTATTDGKSAAIAVHSDYSLVQSSPRESARSGEAIFIYCTGLGAVDKTIAAGSAGPSNPLANTSQKTTVSMGGRQAQVLYAGLAPGFAGLYQINFIVPPELGGDVKTIVSVGNALSSPVTINVRGVFTIGASYSGTLNYKTGEKYRLHLSSLALASASSVKGEYRVFDGLSLIDTGSFLFENTPDFFVALGRSSTNGPHFVGAFDSEDAGTSFFGLLYKGDTFADITNAGAWYASVKLTQP